MDVAFVIAGALAGVLVAPVLRGLIFVHSVEVGQQWRHRCPDCSAPVRIIVLTGRCPSCRARLGPPIGTVEAVSGAVLGLLAWRVHDVLPLLALGWIAVIGVGLAFIDVAVHRLPDRLTLSAFGGAALMLALAGQPARIGVALLCALGMAGCYLLLIVIHPSGMGLGDGKLALSLGLALGWSGGIVTVYGTAAGFLLSGLYAVIMLISGRLGVKDTIAHGPFMLLGALAALTLLP